MAEVSIGRFPWSEANVLRLELESQGIAVTVAGEDRTALTGAVPSTETDVELRVDEKDLERARTLIATAVKEKEQENAARARVPRRAPIFTWLFAAATVVLGVLLYKERQRVTYVDGVVTWSEAGPCVVASINGKRQAASCDRDGDGVFEEQETFDTKGRRVSMFFDANQNGSYDKVENYDSRGKLMGLNFDADDDGRFDRSETFDSNGRRVAVQVDSDKNGNFETSEEYDIDGKLIVRGADGDENRRFERLEVFDRQGVMATRFLDTDRDGRLNLEEGDGGLLAQSR